LDVVEGARAGGAQERCQFRERLFDGVEIRAVRRQESEPRPDGVDGRPDFGLFVHRQVVEHHHIAGPQRRRQDLLDIRAKAGIVDRAVEDPRRREALEPQAGNDCVGFPVAEGRVIAEAFAARAPAIAPEQIRRHAAFIEEDILPDVAERLPDAPALAGPDDIRATLFVGVNGFF
jgi:hypothetical protein